MGEEKNKKKKVNESFRIESTVTRFIVCSEGGLMSRNQKNIEKEKQVFFSISQREQIWVHKFWHGEAKKSL